MSRGSRIGKEGLEYKLYSILLTRYLPLGFLDENLEDNK